MAFIEVPRGGRDAQGAERPDATDTQDQLLVQAHLAAADVEGMGDGPVALVVEGRVRVQQQQRHAADLDHPDGHLDRPAWQLHGHREWVAHLVRDPLQRQQGHVQVRIRVLLVPIGVDGLPEVAMAVEQSDGHERQGHVRGGLAVVACQHAQAAGVDAQRFVQPELGAEVGDRAVQRPAMVPVEPVALAVRTVCVVGGEQGPVLDHEVGVVQQGRPVPTRLEDRDRTPESAPGSPVDTTEQGSRLGMPRPVQVVRDAFQALELCREAKGPDGQRRDAGGVRHDRACYTTRRS